MGISKLSAAPAAAAPAPKPKDAATPPAPVKQAVTSAAAQVAAGATQLTNVGRVATAAKAATSAKAAKDGAGGIGIRPTAPVGVDTTKTAKVSTTKESTKGGATAKPGAAPTAAHAGTTAAATERIEQIEQHQPSPVELKLADPADRAAIQARYQAERSEMYADVATDLETAGPPQLADFQQSGLNAPTARAEYEQALLSYGDVREVAQQGAREYREAHLRAELAETEDGRRLLEFEERSGVTVRILTDRELDAQGNDGAAGVSYGDNVDIRSGYATAQVYIHEMTHQVDDKTNILATTGDTRTQAQVVAEATAAYERYGLDPTEVEAVVAATYHQSADSGALSHGHTRLAEAKLERVVTGGAPLTEAEIASVIDVSVPRELDIHAIDVYHDGGSAQELVDYARDRGVAVAGLSIEEVEQALQDLVTAGERTIDVVERGVPTREKAVDVGGADDVNVGKGTP